MTVEQILNAEYTEHKMSGSSYFEHYISLHKEVEKDEYREHHRKYLEYFVKKARDQLILLFKKEEQSANGSF